MKVSLSTQANTCCPQAFYAYGTYKEDGTPNFGLFCWFSFCWDGELCVMACIGGEKLTKDRIRSHRPLLRQPGQRGAAAPGLLLWQHAGISTPIR